MDPNDRIDPRSVPPLPTRITNVTDLRTVRRARARTRCEHRHSLLDERARVLECHDCGASLDPYAILSAMIEAPEFLSQATEKCEQLAGEVENMRKEHETIRARVTAAKRDARKHDVETRAEELRNALDTLRIRARTGRISATYVAHLTSAVLKGTSVEYADSHARNAAHIEEQHTKRSKRIL